MVHEKQSAKQCQTRALLSSLLTMLNEPEAGTADNKTASALCYAKEVLAFEAAPLHVREQQRAAKARHFANHNGMRGMDSKPPSAKQVQANVGVRRAGLGFWGGVEVG